MTTTPSREDWEDKQNWIDFEKLDELEDKFRNLLEEYDFNSYILTEYFHEFRVALREYAKHILQSHNNALVAEIDKLQKNTKRTEFYGICHSCNSDEKCGCADFNEALDTIIRIIQEK